MGWTPEGWMEPRPFLGQALEMQQQPLLGRTLKALGQAGWQPQAQLAPPLPPEAGSGRQSCGKLRRDGQVCSKLRGTSGQDCSELRSQWTTLMSCGETAGVMASCVEMAG